MREMCGDYIKESDKLFTTERGDTMNPTNLMHWLDAILKEAGLEHHSLHSLRHTNITLQLLAGVPLVTVSARAGHSKVSTTSDIYSHVVQSSDRQAAEMLDELLKSKLKKD
jgi:integrase